MITLLTLRKKVTNLSKVNPVLTSKNYFFCHSREKSDSKVVIVEKSGEKSGG
jgi:hypothetical protein